MTYELYTISGAPRPWRVALALVAKGLPFTPRILEASRKEQKSAAFLALNPRGRTPVIVRGDFVLTESLAILAHLEHAHPQPPLFPDPARVWEQVMTLDQDLHAAASAVNGPVLKGADDESVRDAAPRLLAELRRLDERVARSPYLCGERITAADCVAFPDVRLALRAAERAPDVMRRLALHPLAETVPQLVRWIDRIEAMPGYERTFPTHWHPVPIDPSRVTA
jgi:glutathione S-transferase